MEISDDRIALEVEYDYEEFKRIYLEAISKIVSQQNNDTSQMNEA